MPKRATSWEGVAYWYDDYLKGEDTYQKKVILPNLLRLLAPQKGEHLLDLACGQGFFAGEVARLGARVTGADIAPELIEQAKKTVKNAHFYTTPASSLSFADAASFDGGYCILALQNIEDLAAVCKELQRVLKKGARFIVVVNHPAFRVLRRSSWGYDEKEKVQYRRIDGYLSPAKVKIDLHPGVRDSRTTLSYHRSLQDLFKLFTKQGFAVTRLEEWISHKTSEQGPRQEAEDTARKEIPLFMALELTLR